MTDFIETEYRHYCRNHTCRSKLKAPVSNEREAFCVRGCHTSFYLHRCRICEKPIEQPKRGRPRVICKKAKCIGAWQTNSGLGRYHSSQSAELSSETPIKSGLKMPLKTDRGVEWAIAVNSSRIRAPRRVLDAVFGRVPPI